MTLGDYKDLPPEFEAKNARRVALIGKQHSGFTEEESNRRFDEHPGWEQECERRYQANLTPEEHAELAELERWVEEAMRPHDEARLKALNDYLDTTLRRFGFDPKFDADGRLIESSLKKSSES